MATQRIGDLPLLPGYRQNVTSTSNNFKKSHIFDFKPPHGKSVNIDAPGIGGIPLPGQKEKTLGTTRQINKTMSKSVEEIENVPSFIAFDRKVLRFYAYYQEGIDESRDENTRHHRCVIYSYLDDDSMQIDEPRQDNSGKPQGTIIRRHQFQRPDDPQKFYKWDDLNIGIDIEFYGVIYHIVDADPFTKDFFNRVGIPLGQIGTYPVDQWEEKEKNKFSFVRTTTTGDPEKLALRQFLRLDRKVLRFLAVWDDTNEAFGDVRQFVIHYYLADDTIDVCEVYRSNSGYVKFPVFTKRQRIPKEYDGPGISKKIDSAISSSDMMVGRTVDILKRPFLLYDCDKFTKKYYTDVFGITNFPVVQLPKRSKLIPIQEIFPDELGIGSEEDTLQNVKMINPTAPKKDFHRIVSFEGVGLRYSCKLLDCAAQDANRRFVLSAFPSDDTFSMYEYEDRNSGIWNGKYLERGRYKKETGDQSQILCTDIRVGEVLRFLGKQVYVFDADDFTLHYKLGHSHPDQLVPLPLLKGYPITPDIKAALTHVHQLFVDTGLSPQEVASQSQTPEDSSLLSLAIIRRVLLDWGIEPRENTFLGLTAFFDKSATNTTPKEFFLETFSK